MPTTLISGANRGIGLAMVRVALADDWRVLATARQPQNATELRACAGPDQLEVLPLDLANFASIAQLKETLGETPLDVLLSNGAITGVPDTAFGETDYDAWAELMHVNAMAPMKLAETLVENVAASERRTMFFISSRVGPNPKFGYVAYRSAKSALSQVAFQIALTLKERGVIANCAHPGWVSTAAARGPGAMSPEACATMLWPVIANLTLADTGKFFDPDGSTLPIVTQQTDAKPYGMTQPG